jgi:uncharacterized damage-inducible protein DinB
MTDLPIAKTFIRYARSELLEDYLPKIRACLELLSEEDVWWRGPETNNSVGNLLLHLSGNVRQWIVSSIGGEKDRRNRPAEFAARGSSTKQALLQQLEETLHEAGETLARFDVSRLTERRTIQGMDVTCLEAIFHVVEHFSGHTGQIIYITKLRTGKDLKFYNL